MLIDEDALLLFDPVSIDITCKAVGDDFRPTVGDSHATVGKFRPTSRSTDIKSTAVDNFRATLMSRRMDNPLTRTNSANKQQESRFIFECTTLILACTILDL
jgi:hypothetical protein